MNRSLIIILVTCLFSCSSQSPNFFIGKWQILSVVENDQHIVLKNNWMHLKEDGSFDSYDGDSDKSETGNWEYEPKEKLLNIIGNAGDEDNSKWILLMRNDTLIFTSSENNLELKAIKMK
ncbi:hypothetical protein [Roseivirga sp. E12]|uniref:hypothetical protein n=1 Tax=Roseivirga sp. E12 TaxID=2819237 RepID=UPI001ABBECDE|nr:hypothetical protein [Roseivirga sp. E12]MBO3700205.1 hypothetical protein [Roseivirga sp. E12]